MLCSYPLEINANKHQNIKMHFAASLLVRLDVQSARHTNQLHNIILFEYKGRFNDGSGFEKLKERIENDPRLTLEVKREVRYYQDQSEAMSKFLRILGMTLTVIFSLGAIIGAMITMYASVANRVAEIGTLRALGFQRTSILAAFLSEALLLGLIGGLVGVFFASFMQLVTISTMNWQTFSELAFSFRLTISTVLESLAFSLIMGLAGGLVPALRAGRMSIVDALRES